MAGRIRAYLKDQYENHNLEYAVIVGGETDWDFTPNVNDEMLPVRYCCYDHDTWMDEDAEPPNEDNNYHRIASDIYFADFDGDYDLEGDANEYYGETYSGYPDYINADPIDMYTEIYVGRVVTSSQENVANDEQVKRWAEKLITYETNPGYGSYSYLTKSVLFNGYLYEDYDNPNSPYRLYMGTLTNILNNNLDYFNPINTTRNPSNPDGIEIINEMNGGYGITHFYYHGCKSRIDNYATRTEYVLYALDKYEHGVNLDGDGLDNLIANNGKYFFIYSISCNVGAFDRSGEGDGSANWGNKICMAESFTTYTKNRGGPIMVANTCNGLTYASEAIEGYFLQDIFENEIYAVGEALANAKTHASEHIIKLGTSLFGDPSSEIWTDTPAQFTSVSITDNGSSISVNAGVSGCDICACSGNNGANFYSVAYSTSSHTFNTSVRPLYITITKHNYIPYTAVTGGTFASNEYWFGNLFVRGDITVSSGYTLMVREGSKITFATSDDRSGGLYASKCEIIVNGTLKADSATFTGPTKGLWYGIRFTSSSSSYSYLKKCTIKNAYYAVDIDSKNPQVYKCFIDDADKYGVYIRGSSGNPWVQENYIEADIGCIGHFNGGRGNCIQNSLRNAYYGSYVVSGTPIYDYCSTGRNKFETSITKHKVKIDAGQPIISPNQYFTIPNSGYKYIYNQSASTINARSNFWSNPPPGTYFYGSVDTSNSLKNPPTSPPAGPTWSLPKASGDDFFLEFERGIVLLNEGKYKEAREIFKELTDKYWETEYSSYALNWYMLATEQLEDISTQTEYLNLVKDDKSAHPNTNFYALKWLLQCEMRKGTVEKSIKLAEEVEPGSIYDREISLDLAMGLFEYQNNKQAAEEVLNGLSAKFKDDDTEEVIDMIREQFVEEIIPEKPISKSQATEKAEPVLASFPNPSNASFKINFRTENPGHVSVVIYNILGQKVFTLVDKKLEAGRHEVIWNGKDMYEVTVSSGLYICRLESVDGNKSIKLLMSK